MRNDYVIIVAIILVALVVVFAPGWIPVRAQGVTLAPATEIPDYCVETSRIGNVQNVYCEPDIGPRYIANNAGFLQAVD